MDEHPTNRRPKFNKRELICAVIASLCYAGSIVCFYVHTKRKNLIVWKLKVSIAMYLLSIAYTVFIGFQKFGYIRYDFMNISAEIARACNLIGPVVTFWDIPLFDGEYSNVALFAMLLGSVCLATTLIFIAPINTDFGLLVLLCGSTVKLAWENDNDDRFIWLRTAAGCTLIILVRYLVDNEVRKQIAVGDVPV